MPNRMGLSALRYDIPFSSYCEHFRILVLRSHVKRRNTLVLYQNLVVFKLKQLWNINHRNVLPTTLCWSPTHSWISRLPDPLDSHRCVFEPNPEEQVIIIFSNFFPTKYVDTYRVFIAFFPRQKKPEPCGSTVRKPSTQTIASVLHSVGKNGI